MTPEDRAAFAEVVIGFAEIKGKTLSAPAIELYWRAMQDWTIEEFKQAAAYLLRTCEWLPTPKHFEDLRKAGRPAAIEAWAKALAHCESGAWRRGASSGDPRVDATAAMVGGFERIALCETTWLGALERRFCEYYETLQDVTDVRSALPALARDELPLLENTQRRLA